MSDDLCVCVIENVCVLYRSNINAEECVWEEGGVHASLGQIVWWAGTKQLDGGVGWLGLPGQGPLTCEALHQSRQQN